MVALVDCDHVGNLHDPGLERLDRVTGTWHQHEHDGIGDPYHLDLALAGSYRLEEDKLFPRGVEDEQRLQGRLGEPAEVSARAHRADEDLRVEEVVGEANPVAEQGAVGERARGVDRDHADRRARFADVADERRDQGRLADPGRAGDADGVGSARVRINLPDEVVRERVGVLDERDRARKRPLLPGTDARGERLAGEVAAGCHEANSR